MAFTEDLSVFLDSNDFAVRLPDANLQAITQ